MPGHLGALVPGQRPAQLRRQRRYGRYDCVAHGLGAAPRGSGAVLARGALRWPGIGGKWSSIVNRVVRSTSARWPRRSARGSNPPPSVPARPGAPPRRDARRSRSRAMRTTCPVHASGRGEREGPDPSAGRRSTPLAGDPDNVASLSQRFGEHDLSPLRQICRDHRGRHFGGRRLRVRILGWNGRCRTGPSGGP